ncbi:hypothetical protein BDV93DRAFT_517745 [Ceratobasidium sp. AG-I]|nr:hypothetical protein BDV93DRAFT_517745 [Ceratobasidium sp. AG-I]
MSNPNAGSSSNEEASKHPIPKLQEPQEPEFTHKIFVGGKWIDLPSLRDRDKMYQAIREAPVKGRE